MRRVQVVSWMRLPAMLAVMVALAGVTPSKAQQTVGLFLNTEDSWDGYTLFAPTASETTYLIDNQGKLVRSWVSTLQPGLAVYLRLDGSLIRANRWAPGGDFSGSGGGGRIEQYSWEGALDWDYIYSDATVRQHHDIEPLPNGNVLLIAWEYKTAAEAIAAGRDPALLPSGELWPDHIVEIEPVGATGGNIVWEWHVWDHLIQDFDMTKANFGVVADHPELIDINYTGPNPSGQADWNHLNAIDYNEDLDQIIISCHRFRELWVIDHSTTTAEAAGHTGGNSGKGGDLLYRWGNPEAYDRGVDADRKLFGQHDTQWIEPGRPGAGNILIFNNGNGRPGGLYSSVDELEPPVDMDGNYEVLLPGETYGPEDFVWSYVASPPEDFYAPLVSGAQRQPNGNTLICDGPDGTLFEVTSTFDLAWLYVSPVTSTGVITQGDPANNSAIFKAPRYAADFPGFAGKDLTPGDPLELYTKPIPAEGVPMTCDKITAAADEIEVIWDSFSCPATDYNLIYGNLADVASYDLQGAECGLGITGTHDWLGVPPGDLYFLIVGVDDTGVYESSWGTDGSAAERNGTSPSNTCTVTYKDVAETCP